MSKIIAFHIGHDSSVSVFENGNLTYYKMGERVSREKHYESIDCLLNPFIGSYFETVVVSYIAADGVMFAGNRLVENDVGLISKSINSSNFKLIQNEHHINHAYCGMYSLGLEKATVLVMDGSGSNFKYIENGIDLETESIYNIDKNIDLIYKRFTHFDYNTINYSKDNYGKWKDILSFNKKYFENVVKDKFEFDPDISVAGHFELCGRRCGFGRHSAGKVMGLAQYKDYPAGAWEHLVNHCNEVQVKSEERTKELIQKCIGNHKDIILTGGYALNCVNNAKILDYLPEGYTLHIDPIPFDAGQSIGAGYREYLNTPDSTPKSLDTIYIGEVKYNYAYCCRNTYEEIVKDIIDGKVIGIFQGNSEAGQRALGNRSILFDPRLTHGKDLVNQVKKRESFRPFGGSVLEEHAHEWFDMKVDTSPYMQYAFKIKRNEIPAITHIDNTCRIQTVNKEQNLHLYNIIKEFYKQTGVPILGNTSLNMAGKPLVEEENDLNEMNIKVYRL